MGLKSMHEVQVRHTWKEVDSAESYSERLGERVGECEQCGTRSRVHYFLPRRTSPKPRSSLFNLDVIAEGVGKFLEGYNRELEKLLDSSGYPSYDSLLQEIDDRYESNVDGNTLTLGQLWDWSDVPTKKLRRKAMLLYGQGFVCNRCDSFIDCWADLEVDHIVPRSKGGGPQLTNLQLLCRQCHKDKRDALPDERDISPFSYTGQPCVHVISCAVLGGLKVSHMT